MRWTVDVGSSECSRNSLVEMIGNVLVFFFSRFWFFYFWGWFWELLEFKFFFINKFDFFIKLKGNDSSYITDHGFDGEEFIHKSNFHLIIRINKFT